MKLPKGVYKPGYSADMKKSGKINIFEPTDTSWANGILECTTLFTRASWFSFFERITGFNLEVSYHFAQNFINYTIKFDTLKFDLTYDLIAEAIGVLRDG